MIDKTRAHHHRERLLYPAEAGFEFPRVFLDAAKMETPDAPDREDLPGIEEGRRLPDRVDTGNIVPDPVHKPEPGAAGAAGNRLCMVAPGMRVAVLPCTGRARGKFVHACPFPVVGDCPYDAVPGPAVHAGGCPITLVPPAGSKNIRDTIVADRYVRGDHAGEGAGPACEDNKPVRDPGIGFCHADRIDPGHRRAPGDCCKKIGEPLAPGIDLHLAPEVLYRARDPELTGPGIDKRAESDTLDDAANRNPALFLHDGAA